MWWIRFNSKNPVAFHWTETLHKALTVKNLQEHVTSKVSICIKNVAYATFYAQSQILF